MTPTLPCTSLPEAAPLQKQGETRTRGMGGGKLRPRPGAKVENADIVSERHQIKAEERRKERAVRAVEGHSAFRGSSLSISALPPNVQ